MVSTPARIASLIPAVPCACTATLKSQHVRLVHDRLHLREVILLGADGIGLREHAAGAAKFDDLGAVLAQFAHRGANLLGTVGDGGSRRRDRRRELRGIAMAAGRADGVGRRNDPRSRNDTLLDALLDGDVVEVRASPRCERW